MRSSQSKGKRDAAAAVDQPSSDRERYLAMIPKVIDATSDVFQTMVFTTLKAGPPVVDGKQPVATVVGAIRFLGSLSGTVSFYCSDAAAREIAGTLLGISPDDAAAEVADTVGEITNMIAGTLRGRFAQGGDTLMITPPTVTRGNDFCAQHFNVAARILCPFSMNDHDVFVELILQST